MPNELFGITGLNPVNLVWLATFGLMLVIRSNRYSSYYFSLTFVLFLFAFATATLWTAIGIHSLHIPYGVITPTSFGFIVVYMIIPMQVVVSGWMVFKYCVNTDSKQIELVILSIPLIMLPFVIYFYVMGMVSGVEEYSKGRDFISAHIGMHANELGALGAITLAYLLGQGRRSWTLYRTIVAGASLLVIIFSFSRISYLATIIILFPSLRGLTAKQQLVTMGLVLLVIIAFSPLLFERVQYGMDSKTKDIDSISAGRVDGLWIPSIKTVASYPLLGQGLMSIWKLDSVKNSGRNYLPNSPHNAYLEVALDMGVVGLCVLAAMLYGMWKTARFNRGFLFVLVAWCVIGLTGYTFYPLPTTFSFWVLYGLTCANECKLRNRLTTGGSNIR